MDIECPHIFLYAIVFHAFKKLAQSRLPLGVRHPGVRRSPDCEARPAAIFADWLALHVSHTYMHKDPDNPILKYWYLNP